VNLPDNWEKPVIKCAVAFRTADTAAADNITEGRAAASAPNLIIFFFIAKEFPDNPIQAVSKPGKKITAAKLKRTFRTKGVLRQFSARDSFDISCGRIFSAALTKHFNSPH
jgi:hypothetical protein